MNIPIERINTLLLRRGIKAAKMCDDLEIPKSTWYTWVKTDKMPESKWLLPIARYFGVTTDYLLGADEESDAQGYYMDPNAKELANALNENPGQRVLFDAAKDLPAEDLLKVLDFIQQQNKKEGRD